MQELNALSERRSHYKNKLKSLSSLYYKSATLCFFSKVLVTKFKYTWIAEAPRGLNKK